MKLIYRLALRLTMVVIPLLSLWGVLFYVAMVDEINDEADDSLEDYASLIMTRHLAGEPLPLLNSGSNNHYQLRVVDADYAVATPHLAFRDANYYIPEKQESEPARVLTTLFRTMEGQWLELEVAMPTFEKEDLLETLLGWIVFLYLLLMFFVVTLSMWVIHRGMQPLYRLLQWIDTYTPGRRIPLFEDPTDITEFCHLNEAVRQMTGRSEDLYDRQKQFIGNASHELQTPLAVLGNRMEWMLDTMQLNEEQMGEVIRMLQTQRHLVRLNRNLLLLTKIDNGQFPDSQPIDLVRLITDEQVLLDEVYADRSIRCRLLLPDRYVVTMNDSLASVLISNLLRNAYLHSPEGALVEVQLEGCRLIISNDGEQSLDSSRIFERFYQGSKREGSTGLGLALARAVAESYRLALDYEYRNGRHRFKIDGLIVQR